MSKLSGATWNTRFLQLWMMPKLYTADDAFYNAHQGILYYAINGVVEDLEQRKPEIIFVEVSDTLYSLHFNKPINWVSDFSTIPTFKQAWEHYTFIKTIDNCTLLQPAEAAVINRPTGAGQRLIGVNCHFDVYRRLP